jgi:hypothetical protein
MNDPEREHLLLRVAELDRARRRWKVLALVGTPALLVLLLLALGNAVSSLVALRAVVLRERQAREDALREVEVLREAEVLLHKQADAEAALAEAQRALDGPARHGKPLSLSLEVVEPAIGVGTTPTFRLTVKNTSERAEKVLDIRRRPDLQDTYYELEVTKDGERVNVPRAISDPGPINDEAFLSLAPGESVTFVLSRFAQALERLPPGRYEASVRFWQDPYQGHETSYNSPEVSFTVRK